MKQAFESTGRGDTKDRILDTAERLFADHGFAATSLRQITAEANEIRTPVVRESARAVEGSRLGTASPRFQASLRVFILMGGAQDWSG